MSLELKCCVCENHEPYLWKVEGELLCLECFSQAAEKARMNDYESTYDRRITDD